MPLGGFANPTEIRPAKSSDAKEIRAFDELPQVEASRVAFIEQSGDEVLTALLQNHAKKKFSATDRPRGGRSTVSGSRHIPAQVKRPVCLAVGRPTTRRSPRGAPAGRVNSRRSPGRQPHRGSSIVIGALKS